jgi:hypothetical protein
MVIGGLERHQPLREGISYLDDVSFFLVRVAFVADGLSSLLGPIPMAGLAP